MVHELTILVIEDDPKILKLISSYLERENFRVLWTASGAEGLKLAQTGVDLVILDLMLPDLSGFDVCDRLREKSDLPILIVSALVDEADRLSGMALGADDYVIKPFSPRELVARVKAILRRTGQLKERRPRLALNGVAVAPDRHQVMVDNVPVRLTAFEFKLLTILMSYPERVFTREELLSRVYPGETALVVDRTIDVHIGKLRQKIEQDPEAPRRIQTIRGVGYKFCEGEAGRDVWAG